MTLFFLHRDDNSHVGDNMGSAYSTRLDTKLFRSAENAKLYAKQHTKLGADDEIFWQKTGKRWYWDAGYLGWEIEPAAIWTPRKSKKR